MEIIDAAATRAALPFERLIPALRAMFVAGCETPARHVHRVETPGRPPGTVLLMPAWQAGPPALLGVKTVNVFPGNAGHGLPGLFASYMLYDAQTGRPLAHIDGNEITARRTAAASALAASYLAPADARRLLVVGCGRVARVLPDAYAAVLALREVRIWNRTPAPARALADELRDRGFDAEAVDDLPAAVGRADVVSCATLAEAPVLRGEWLRPGGHLDLIGSFTPAMREADDACIAGARVFVDTREALSKSGDLLGPLQSGALAVHDVRGDLTQLCRGEAVGRSSDGPAVRTVFKSVGMALEDLAAARLVWQRHTGMAAARAAPGDSTPMLSNS